MATIHNALTNALRHHQAGRLRTAENIYRQVLQADSQQADALHYLGLVYHQMDRDEEAIDLMEEAISLHDGNAAYHRNLGNVLNESGRFDEALAAYKRADDLAPNAPETFNNLAALLSQMEKYPESLEYYQKAVRLQPNYAQAHYNLGTVLFKLGNYDVAHRCLDRALQLHPQYASAHRAKGDVYRAQSRVAEAVQSYQQALSISWNNRKPEKSQDSIIDLCDQVLELAPTHLHALELLAVSMMDDGRHAEATEVYHRAIAAHPQIPTLRHGLASAERVLGRFDSSTEQYREAIRLNPKCAEHYFNLSAVRKFTKDDPELRALEQLLAAEDLSDEERSFAHFAAGKMYDDLGDYDSAFQHYRQGNIKRRARFDCDDCYERIDQMVRTVNRDLILNHNERGHDTDAPIFVVGTPRSGTTLTEQILASHPEVFGAGELQHISAYASRTPSHSTEPAAYPQCLGTLRGDSIEEWSHEHLARLRKMAPDARRIVDKHPLNFRHLGLIAMLYPNARVIHCRRNPLDACLSMYFHKFRNGQEYSYSLTHLGYFYRAYLKLMAHWRQELPLPMFELDYEQLVSDQEPTVRKLLEFCDLDWHEGCLDFHKTERAVTTASNWQVRHGWDRTRMARWQKYESHLGPLLEALGLNAPVQVDVQALHDAESHEPESQEAETPEALAEINE